MATYRQFKPSIWCDPDFLEYPPEHKLIFIYLFTNKAMTESGIYPISTFIISMETRIQEDVVRTALSQLKNIIYDAENKCVFIRNYRKHSTIGGKKDLMEKSIKNDFVSTHKSPLWHYFVKEYPQYEKIINNGTFQLPLQTEVVDYKGLERVDKGFDKGLERVDKGFDKGLEIDTKNNEETNPLERVVKPFNRNSNRSSNSNRVSVNNSNISPNGDENSSFDNSYVSLRTLIMNPLTKNKPAILVRAFKAWHSDAPVEDFDDIFEKMSGLIKKNKYDYGLTLQLLHETVTKPPGGSHVTYLMGIIENKKKDKFRKDVNNGIQPKRNFITPEQSREMDKKREEERKILFGKNKVNNDTTG